MAPSVALCGCCRSSVPALRNLHRSSLLFSFGRVFCAVDMLLSDMLSACCAGRDSAGGVQSALCGWPSDTLHVECDYVFLRSRSRRRWSTLPRRRGARVRCSPSSRHYPVHAVEMYSLHVCALRWRLFGLVSVTSSLSVASAWPRLCAGRSSVIKGVTRRAVHRLWATFASRHSLARRFSPGRTGLVLARLPLVSSRLTVCHPVVLSFVWSLFW